MTAKTAATEPTAATGGHPQRWLILGVICLAQLTVLLDNTVLSVAIPSLTSELHATTTDIQWMINAYSLVQSGLLLSAGNAADRYGRKKLLAIGLALFGIGSLCLELPAVPMEGLLERIPSGKAQRVRAKLRKLDALGIDARVVPGAEVPAALDRLLRLHRLQWQGRGVTAEHTSDRFAQHLTRAVRPMVERGDAMVTEFRLAGDVVAADLTLMSPRLAGEIGRAHV